MQLLFLSEELARLYIDSLMNMKMLYTIYLCRYCLILLFNNLVVFGYKKAVGFGLNAKKFDVTLLFRL